MQRCSRSLLAPHFVARPRILTVYSARTIVHYVHQAKAQPSAFMRDSPETQDSTIYPLSSSPFPDLRARAQSIKKISKCPVCTSHTHLPTNGNADTPSPPKLVAFECPDCGYPTHCSKEHWREDTEHRRYCGRLREVNEDDHDLRSRRQKIEYELPGTRTFTTLLSH
jgi:mitochondrial splicing suppressor protein 51